MSRVHHRQLPVRDVLGAVGQAGHRVARGQPAGHRPEQLLAQSGVGRALAAHRPTPARTAAHRAATAMLAEAITAPTAPVRSQRPTSENVMA